MRIVWMAKEPASGGAGDEIYDAKMISALRSLGYSIDVFHPKRLSTTAELANFARGVPHPRTRYASTRNLQLLREVSAGHDIIVSCGEPLDWLAVQLATPVVLILHNVISRALPNLFPGSLPIAALAGWARRFERRNYSRNGPVKAIGVLSRRDQAFIRGLPDPPEVIYLPPGMPPALRLDSDAILRPEILLSGTFDWRLKKRDVMHFARDYAASGSQMVVRADRLPREADGLLKPLAMPTDQQLGEAIRLGVISDRFEAGHKLKTLAYIARNQIVLTFADVSFDFDHIPDHELFIRRVESFAHMKADIDSLSLIPPQGLYDRFVKFKQRCADCFRWDTMAKLLGTSLERIVC